MTELEKDKDYVRTNHGIHFKNAGYPIVSDDEKMILNELINKHGRKNLEEVFLKLSRSKNELN